MPPAFLVRNMLGLIALGALSACGAVKGPLASQAAAAHPDWRRIATDDDRARLRGWRDAWTAAAAAVRKAGDGAKLDADTALFDPDRALDTPVPPPGAYSCRWFKLGGTAPAVAAFTAYPAVPCRVSREGALTRFAVGSGAQRPQGLIFDDVCARAVFLGTLVLGDEAAPLAYGRDEKRDMAGYVERIGDERWRLVLPSPHFESTLDLIEIAPADS